VSTFTYHGKELNRFDHLYNSTAISERGVEVATAVDVFANSEGSRLEVGNVLQHYEDAIQHFPRRIVDLYEVAPNVENIDVFDIEGEYDTIVSISTLEHVGFDYEPKMPGASGTLLAIAHLRGLLSPTGTLLVTIPVGFNRALDVHLAGLTDRYTYLCRIKEPGWASEWVERDYTTNPYYGTVTPWANTVWIGEFTRD
jgi:hypothetical protein